MAENTKIEWTDHTFNPWVGCTKISPGCDHCYAESWAKRTGSAGLWNGERRRTTAANWRKPLKWNADAAARAIRYRVFCASLADVFDNDVDRQWRYDLWDLIASTPHLDWLLLTKRIGNASAMFPGSMSALPNVWLGATVVTQRELERDLPKLLATPARVRFLSCEPLLEPVDIFEAAHRVGQIVECCGLPSCAFCDGTGEAQEIGLHWVIAGGESGPGARPMRVEWCGELAEQCDQAGIAFFMKQGSAANWPDFKNFESFPEHLRVREFPR